jgi:hypothetical protein
VILHGDCVIGDAIAWMLVEQSHAFKGLKAERPPPATDSFAWRLARAWTTPYCGLAGSCGAVTGLGLEYFLSSSTGTRSDATEKADGPDGCLAAASAVAVLVWSSAMRGGPLT